tara:strand:- start:1388 stop:1666 length:279 start_codon:yes stop_codon:yes gene_type:complete
MKIVPLGHALSLFLAITFTICMLWGLTVPMHMMMGNTQVNMHMHQGWAAFMPGFHWSIAGYLIGLAWAYAYGWYTALLFMPLYNFFNKKSPA